MYLKVEHIGVSALLSCLLALPGWAQNGWLTSYEPDVVIDSGAVAQSLASARDIRLNNSTLTGGLMAGREVEARNCKIGGMIKAGRDVLLENCPEVGGVQAGRSVSLLGTTVNRPVQAGRGLTLRNSRLQGDASVGQDVVLEQSAIEGQLQTSDTHVMLDASRVGSIRIEGASAISDFSSGSYIGNGQVVMNGSSIISRNGITTIGVGNSGTSSINGYTVRSSNGATTVITPDNSVYINGKNVSGNTPESYADYQALHADAPHIQGLAWASAGEGQTQGLQPVKVVELRNGSQVDGDIVFEGGQGSVRIDASSKLLGRVVGGSTEKI